MPVKLDGYDKNYIAVKFNGSYTHNTSGTTYWLTNNTLTKTLMSTVSYPTTDNTPTSKEFMK